MTNGNARIAVTGGIWDMDNLKQSPNPGWQHLATPPRPKLKLDMDYDPTFYRGNAFYFENVTDFRFARAVIRNPVTYAFQLCRVSDFTVEHVRFDFTTENPIKGNMDGIHLDGGCRRGRIAHLRGTCSGVSCSRSARRSDRRTQSRFRHSLPGVGLVGG